MRYGGWGGENHYSVNLSSSNGKYGDNVLKVVFSTPDGKTVEKNLPFQLNPTVSAEDGLYFYTPSLVRNVGKNVDFTLYYDTPFPKCKALAFTLDGQPVDVPIPDNPASAFGRFGRFIFTLYLSDLPEGIPAAVESVVIVPSASSQTCRTRRFSCSLRPSATT